MSLVKTTLCIPDTHIPEHDPRAVACMLKIARWLMPDEIVILGDFLEAAPWSRHPRKTMPEEQRALFRTTELDPAASLLRRLQWDVTDRLVFVEGNHEHRVQTWCANNAVGPDVYDALSPRAWFEGFCKWIPYQAEPEESHYAITDDLWAVHGWATGMNVGRKHLQRSSDFSIVHGHSHGFYLERIPKPSSRGVLDMYSMSPGCLRTLAPAWLGSTPQAWAHGLTVIYHGAHSWTPAMIPIVDGHARHEGYSFDVTQEDLMELDEIMGLGSANGGGYGRANAG